jgi:UDP-2,4-diacetamido-2,4,6-trideoxy-beta-L-altropyranose hydrolase
LSHLQEPSLQDRVLAEGFDLVRLDQPHPSPADLEKTLQTLNQLHQPPHQQNHRNERGSNGTIANDPWVVLDGYHFTPDYQLAIRKSNSHLLVIDDYNHLPQYHADVLLNQNLHASGLEYSCDQDTLCLLGLEYVLLRREFRHQLGCDRVITDRTANILVTLGGSDPNNVTLKVIDALNSLGRDDLDIKVVVGPTNPNFQLLEQSVRGDAVSIQLVQNADMVSLMIWADAAVAAGGSTCWELSAMGVPYIVLCLAENQRSNVNHLSQNGYAMGLDPESKISRTTLAEALEKLIDSGELRKYLSHRGEELVDGRGFQRILVEGVLPRDCFSDYGAR